MSEYPEINLARRVLEKYKLTPPIDVLALLARYTKVDILRLPRAIDVDGVSFNLKIPGKRPVVILNDSRPPTRKRFTLAHELGHVLIPWHIGTIVDEIDLSDNGKDLSYWELENEANRFAAELLMPQKWVISVIDSFQNPCEMVDFITEGANVSRDAAIIRVINLLGPGYVYALVDDDGFVVSSGCSNGTLVSVPERGIYLDRDAAFPVSDAQWEAHLRDHVWLWWHFPNEVKLPTLSDGRDWRQILDDILSDLDLNPRDAVKMKQTINGIVGYVNRVIGRGLHGSTPEVLYAASMQRFNSRALNNLELRGCIMHSDFPLYLARRVRAFAEK